MAGNKSEAESRVERITWFALVLVFAIITLLPENGIPNYVIPLAGALILFGSGLYQYMRRWRVSPITWVAASGLLIAAGYGYQINPKLDLLPISLLAFAAVIGVGVLTGET